MSLFSTVYFKISWYFQVLKIRANILKNKSIIFFSKSTISGTVLSVYVIDKILLWVVCLCHIRSTYRQVNKLNLLHHEGYLSFEPPRPTNFTKLLLCPPCNIRPQWCRAFLFEIIKKHMLLQSTICVTLVILWKAPKNLFHSYGSLCTD